MSLQVAWRPDLFLLRNRVETILREADDPAQIIVDEAVERATDMIIMGRRGLTVVLKVLMGKVAAKVIGNSPCKVLIVPKAARIGYKNILIATDGSLNSISAASEAIGIAKRRGCNIIALSASSSGLDLAEASANVNKVVEIAHTEGLEAAVLPPIGKPHETILETAARRGVDLIVMGRYGKTDLRNFFLAALQRRLSVFAGVLFWSLRKSGYDVMCLSTLGRNKTSFTIPLIRLLRTATHS